MFATGSRNVKAERLFGNISRMVACCGAGKHAYHGQILESRFTYRNCLLRAFFQAVSAENTFWGATVGGVSAMACNWHTFSQSPQTVQ